jgi:N-acetylmuramoyl-L-alanine amidase
MGKDSTTNQGGTPMKKMTVFVIVAILIASLAGSSVFAAKLSGKKIYIDPGHGGSDPGAVGPSGLKEKDVNLRVATVVRNCLVEYSGATVRMSRTTDVYKSLSYRSNDANNWGAHRFISVHHNASSDRNANYVSTYSYTKVGSTTLDLRNKIHEELCSWASKNGGPRNGGVHTANFHVLRETSMPAVLTEASFISNASEEARLRDRNYTWREGYYIYRGIARHYGVTP